MRLTRPHNAVWYSLHAGFHSHISGGTVKLLAPKQWHAYYNGQSIILPTLKAAKQFVEDSVNKTSNTQRAVRAEDA